MTEIATASLTDYVHLQTPQRVGIGSGAREELLTYLREVGAKQALLILPDIVEELQSDWIAALGEAVEELHIKSGLPIEPSVGDLEALRKSVDALELDTIIAVGGGSVLDLGKLVAALYKDPKHVRDYFGKGLVKKRPLRLVAAPTTAGAGSEASPNAILYDEEAGLKSAVISPLLLPDAVFIEPAFAASLPASVTAATGFDAMCHCIEAFANLNARPAVDFIALEGIRLIAPALPRAVRDGNDLEARAALGLGSYYGGLCLGPVNTAAVHALSYPLGSRYRLAHGLSNAILMPAVFAFNLPAAPARYAAVARALGVEAKGDDMTIARLGVERLRELADECGLKLSLASTEVDPSQVEDLATDALKITRLLQNNPRPVTHEDACAIYREVLSA